MAPLDQFAKISAAEIAFYTPVAIVAFIVALRHGFTRRQGWVFLFTFSIVRIIGAVLTLIYRLQTIPSTGLVIAASILSGVGLSPLLLATHGFVAQINSVASIRDRAQRPLQLARALLGVGLILGVVGGTETSPDNSPSDIKTGKSLTRASSLLFLAAYIILFGIHLWLWAVRDSIPLHHRNVSEFRIN
ncbi:hypothetical protein M422DRAFT_255753 [Sphaerobolus stellatus SS14]|uniref:DUF7702 domain-containing protein n=1 Tax=Sphaerobolus stellatus (strain SS14) TaxID=990650 RepID=A0A0C9VID4_SPHS4|nr:hypothetical protein M422DRAFT_255753 [Sphaerobolus stellatus SS14]